MGRGDGGWAAAELGAARLGDARRTARLVRLAAAVGAQPSASLPQACGDVAGAKAAYRFLANDGVDAQEIVACHVGATHRRAAAVEVVLAVQDTTFVAWPGGGAGGLVVHTTLALTPERVPLGLLAQDAWTRAADAPGRASRKDRPVDAKESRKWLDSLAAVAVARATCPGTAFVSVGDREADVYDLFVAPRPDGVDLLVRAAQDRGLAEPERRLWAAVAAAPVAARVPVAVPRRPGQPARAAVLTVRHRAVTLRPPVRRASERLPLAPVWAVLAREEDPPAGAPPLEWLLLTTVPVATADDARTRVDWYACRWGIEVFHRVLKTGCRLEAKQLGAPERLERCLALYSVVAWRVLYTTMLARDLPDAPCTVLLAPDEWQALYCFTHRIPTPPADPPPLHQAVRWIGQLGGFLGRRHDGHPGPMTLWRGVHRLHDLTAMYALMKSPIRAPTCGER